MGKPTICIAKTKAQISFAVTAKLISAFVFATRIEQFQILYKSKISSFYPASVLVQVGLCRTCSETTLLVFPRGGSWFNNHIFSPAMTVLRILGILP